MLRRVASLWIGKSLGPIELASIRSFLRQGHAFTLFAYEPLENCPPEVNLRDAREIFPGDPILRHAKTGSPALHSDLFRYAMVRQTDFVWVDLDIVALRPFDFADDYIFGYEDATGINGAVFFLPTTSPAFQRMSAITPETRGIPPYLTGSRYVKYWLRNLLQGGMPIAKWPWGATCPRLMTYELGRSGEISRALPVTAFYSVPLAEAHRFADPGGYDAASAPSDAYGVHLWASHLSRYVARTYGGEFPQESFVARVLRDDW